MFQFVLENNKQYQPFDFSKESHDEARDNLLKIIKDNEVKQFVDLN